VAPSLAARARRLPRIVRAQDHTHVSSGKPEALLFDLGGVVIDIDFGRAIRAWQPISRLSCAELEGAFRFDAQYEQHERGEIAASAYFDHLASSLELTGSHEQIADGWNAIYVGEIAETIRMIRLARAKLPVFAFTNTNSTHQAAWSRMFPAVPKSFDRIFASHELGCRKPERRAFELVGQSIGISLDSVMFFDDLLANVEGAEAAGLQSVHVRSPNDVRNSLQGVGVAL
jgi:FMN phosphatase YigB (HAD superfamily)